MAILAKELESSGFRNSAGGVSRVEPLPQRPERRWPTVATIISFGSKENQSDGMTIVSFPFLSNETLGNTFIISSEYIQETQRKPGALFRVEINDAATQEADLIKGEFEYLPVPERYTRNFTSLTEEQRRKVYKIAIHDYYKRTLPRTR